MKTGRPPDAGRVAGCPPGSAAGNSRVVPLEALQQGVESGRRELAAANEKAPDRLLSRLLKREHGADLKRGEQPQTLGGCADLFVGTALREQSLHLGAREIAPAATDFAEAITLPALPDQRLDKGREADDAGMIQVFTEAQTSPRKRRDGAVVGLTVRIGARGSRSGRRSVRRCGVWPTALVSFARSRTTAEMFPKQVVGASGFDETFRASAAERPVGDPVRVGPEGLQLPRGSEPRLLEMAEKRRVEITAEEYVAGLEKSGTAFGIHDASIGEIGFRVSSRVACAVGRNSTGEGTR